MTSTQQGRVRPSFSSQASNRRLSSRYSVEDGQEEIRAAGAAAERNIDEMEEIRRYEDFTTIDWVQDASREQLRRRAKRKANAGPYRRRGRWGIRQKIWEMYDAGQAWIVVTLVGAAIGLNAAFLNIATEWLSDIKRGHCTTAFYLNEKFCCWGTDGTQEIWRGHGALLTAIECEEWQNWSGFFPVDYLVYTVYGVRFRCILKCDD
jgi:chloride channel 3/4/5